MFKQFTVFKLAPAFAMPSLDDLDEMLAAQSFQTIGATQELSVGFIQPRDFEHGQMVESIGGQQVMAVAVETKSVPGSIVRERVAEVCQIVENDTGRKPGKKERRQITEDVVLELLPTAFPKKVHIPVWLDAQRRLIVVGTASQSKVDHVVAALIQAVTGLAIHYLNTVTSPQAAMTQWLLAETPDDWPDNLNIERECVLQSVGYDGATVKFSRHHLANDEVRKHVSEGKLPTALALSWDGKVSFVLTNCLQFKKVAFLDGVMDGGDEHEDRFDADVALSTGLLGPLLDDVIYALGGEITID
jgi:recombination associated protein RdgC